MLLPYLILTAGIVAAEFIPTNEWQKIERDEKVPGGMEVRLDMETGERFVRLPQEQQPAGIPEQQQAGNYQVASLAPEEIKIADKLDMFEDLAHDIDRGHEIMQTYFPSLNALATSSDPRADQAAKVIQAALRHNPKAIKAVLEHDPAYPTQLVGDLKHLTPRNLGIFGSLVSTSEGANACWTSLRNIQSNLNEIDWNDKIGTRLETILEDLKHMSFDLGGWVDSLETAVTQVADNNQMYQLKILAHLMELEPFSPTPAFMHWLSSLVSTSTGSDLVEYAKSLRHRVFGNKHAERVKAEL